MKFLASDYDGTLRLAPQVDPPRVWLSFRVTDIASALSPGAR